jgi:lipoprotein-anchoring transpeptidase ErfK/SrfK
MGPQLAPKGPTMVLVSLSAQRAYVYRNGVRIGASTISSGTKGHKTPTGVFTILQKHQQHYSNKYNNAPMPYMQRLTWDGIALHAGHLPGYAASHGCVRLPLAFSKVLYKGTSLGMTVIVTDDRPSPRAVLDPGIEVITPRELLSRLGL